MYHKLVLMISLFLCPRNCMGQDTDLSTIAYTYCPFTKFCKSENMTRNDPLLSCCDECSCEDDCYLGNRCCPDADIVPSVNDLLVCRSIDELINSHRNDMEEIGELNTGYYVIDACPESFTDADVIEGCLVPKTIREHVLVTDPGTTLIYKNYQCAICNDVFDYDLWNLKLLCSDSDTMFSALVDDETIFRLCRFDSKPPPLSLIGNQTWACYPKAIDTCNVTGQWDAYDDVIVDACATYNMPYASETLTGIFNTSTTMYKNVYCFICNQASAEMGLNDSFAGVTCPRFNEPRETSFGGLAFQSLLDLVRYEAIHSSSQTERRCALNAIEDPLTVPFYGNCTSYMNDIELAFTVILEYMITTANDQPWPEGTPPSDVMINAVFKTIRTILIVEECYFCHIEISPEAVLIQVEPKRNCPSEILFELFQQMTRLKEITSKKDVFGVNVWISTKYSMYAEPNRVIFYSLKSKRLDVRDQCKDAVQLPPKFYCKRIKFSVFDLVHSGKTNATLTRILSRSEPDDDIDGIGTKYAICVDDYSSIANQGSRVRASRMTWLAVTLCILVAKSVFPRLYVYQGAGGF